jgi:tetratricopeptide (TPR) repeat protein
MTVRRIFSVVAALLVAVFAVVGCGDRNNAPLPAETDEPFYVQGKQLMKHGRHAEALTAFLKVIDRRGERGAPESHLEAGSIYLYQIKEPVEAYHHFRRYLTLQPNSKEAAGVRGKVDESLREFARTLPARPLEDQSLKLQAEETIARLQRENEELKAQIATLRGTGATTRSTPMINLPDDPQSRGAAPPVASVIDPSNSANPTTPSRGASGQPGQSQPPTTNRAQPSRTAPPAVTPPPTTRGGRTYVVKQSDGLFAIARQFDSANPSRKLREIVDANRDVLPQGVNTPLKPGMVLKIP